MKAWLWAVLAIWVVAPAPAQQAHHQIQAREMLEKVVGYRSVLGRAETAKIADYLAARFQAAGVPATDITRLTAVGETAMLVRVPGTDPAARPILFSAHMDVVDARPEDWKRDPFTLIEEDGYFFGRGVLDNKTGVVSLASTVLRFRQDGFQPRRTLVFAFIGDEETGFNTTRLVARHPWVKEAEFAINSDAGDGVLGEDGTPLIYLVQGAEKTYVDFDLTARNPGGHSSRPREDNAIHDLAGAVAKVAAYRFPVQSNALSRAYLQAMGEVTPGEKGEMLRRFARNPDDAAAAEALWHDAAFIGTTRTTCVTTMLEAGHAPNALPQRASANVNCRLFPGVSVEAARRQLVEVIGNPAVQVTVKGAPQESEVSEMTPEIEAAIRRAIHAHYPGVPIAPYLESGGTDGLIYRSAGIPTFATSGVFMRPDEMFAHGLDERIPVRAFYEAIEQIHALAVDLSQ